MSDEELVKDLCGIEAGLSTWELEFTESIAARVEAGQELTDGQREKAEEILEAKG